jgi:asparagine synthase (glutamine-hydrolysing)
MKMIYGSIVLANAPELAEHEKQNVARMQAVFSAYPWEAASQRSLAGAVGYGAFAVHTGDRKPGSALLPVLGSLVIAADVRLDNRLELCAALAIEASEQVSLDDAGLILRAYQRWGASCASHLLGDFAFAIWDQAAERLFCARDFAGVRPFYYHYAPGSGRFIFASDLQALSAHPQVPLELNLAYVAAALQTAMGQFQHPEHTYYQAIEKLPPAHFLTLDAGGLQRRAYWQPGQTPERRYAGEREYVEELLTLLQAAVACRVTDPRPVGAHLSGGLDSSSVAVLAHRILQTQGRSLTAFSWSPPLPENPADLLPNDERRLVEAVRQAEGLPVRYTRLTPAYILDHARRDLTQQPTTTLQLEMAASADAAGLGIRTMLSGWGGDELLAFNGRGYFSDLFRRGRWLTLQRELTLRARLHGGVVWKKWISDGVFPLIPPAILRLLRPVDFPPPRPLPAYLRPDFAAALAGISPLAHPEAYIHPGVRRMQIALLQHGHLSYRMESWASHGAALGLTYAFPLLDRRLVEFALSIPDYLFFKNGWKRYLYRTALAGILPDSLRWQKAKEDPAMFTELKSARQEAAGQLRADLLARAANPYIDVVQLQLALDAEDSIREALLNENLSEKEARRLRQQMDAERVYWLAFVNPKANQNKELPE